MDFIAAKSMENDEFGPEKKLNSNTSFDQWSY